MSLRPRVLVIAGEAMVRRALFRDLAGSFEVASVEGRAQALAALARAPADAIVTDSSVADLRPLELLAELRARQPTAARVLVLQLGRGADRVVRSGVAHIVLASPWEEGQAVAAVLRALRRAAQLLEGFAEGGGPGFTSEQGDR